MPGDISRQYQKSKNSSPPECVHEWSGWKEIGRTGDWFHPLIVERVCKKCAARETDEH